MDVSKQIFSSGAGHICGESAWVATSLSGVIIARVESSSHGITTWPLASTHGIFGPHSTECALPAAGLIIALVASNRQGHSTSECAWYFVA